MDHKIPIAAGGTDTPGNWQLAHTKPCNAQKGSSWQGVNYQKLRNKPSPYGIGKHYRRKRQQRYDWVIDADGSNWETPVLRCA